MDWENHLEKISKNRENSEHRSKNAACEQKPLARKRIFVHTPFSHYFKSKMKKVHAAK